MDKAKIITRNKIMQSLLEEVEIIRKSDCPVLIVGETGTGKEILSDYIHANSPRSNKRFVKVSLSSLPESLFESELFGHEKGSYTGADKTQIGFFEAANNASIYLDDIDDFPLPLQPKLLRVIENKELIRIGSNKPVKNDVRIITSSKIELKELVDGGSFRPDLFYRLSVFRLYIPPLRERKEDIQPLFEHFYNKTKSHTGKKLDVHRLSLDPLYDYNWSGNVRELRNFAEKLTLYSEEEIYDNFNTLFSKYIFGNSHTKATEEIPHNIKSGKQKDSFEVMISNYEEALIVAALKRSYGNVNLAARILKMKPSTLRDKICKHKIEPRKYKEQSDISE